MNEFVPTENGFQYKIEQFTITYQAPGESQFDDNKKNIRKATHAFRDHVCALETLVLQQAYMLAKHNIPFPETSLKEWMDYKFCEAVKGKDEKA